MSHKKAHLIKEICFDILTFITIVILSCHYVLQLRSLIHYKYLLHPVVHTHTALRYDILAGYSIGLPTLVIVLKAAWERQFIKCHIGYSDIMGYMSCNPCLYELVFLIHAVVFVYYAVWVPLIGMRLWQFIGRFNEMVLY